MPLEQEAKLRLPSHVRDTAAVGGLPPPAARPRSRLPSLVRVLAVLTLSLALVQYVRMYADVAGGAARKTVNVPLRAQEYLDKCALLEVKPGPPPDFNARTRSDRFVPGTKATLIKVSGGLRGVLGGGLTGGRTRRSGRGA